MINISDFVSRWKGIVIYYIVCLYNLKMSKSINLKIVFIVKV